MTSPAPRHWTALEDAFVQQFGGTPTLYVQAPGRVNLIGEHTDYNDGLVLPAAIDRHVRIVARPNDVRLLRLHSLAFAARAAVSLNAVARLPAAGWVAYVQGVVRELTRRGLTLSGIDAVIGGDLAVGAGLSSSAAFELAVALALEQVSGQPVAARDNALLCQAAETEFVGVPCGIMDQFASALGRRGYVLFLDCRSQETHHIPLPQDLIIAVCDTGLRRTLAASAYHVRRQECRAALELLKVRGRAIQSLRDLTPADLPVIEQLPTPLGRRVRHVVAENGRVLETARLLTGGSFEGLRDVFEASHQSLRDDYEVSCPELDAMVDIAAVAPGCVAVRMTGAGFGGAAAALVERAHRHDFAEAVAAQYRQRTGKPGSVFLTEAVEGAAICGRDGAPVDP